MGRVLFVLLLLGATAVVHPALRASARPYAEAAVRPAFRWYADWRLDEITRLLEAEIANGRPLPTRQTFSQFVERAFFSESSARDPWGTPYFLQIETFRVHAGSAGPDRKIGTADDLLGKPIGTGLNR